VCILKIVNNKNEWNKKKFYYKNEREREREVGKSDSISLAAWRQLRAALRYFFGLGLG
jgi:hypothetical protein